MNNRLPSGDLVIRPASITDIPHIQAIASATWPAAYSSILGEDQLQYMLQKFYSTLSLQQQMEDNHYFFLALKQYQPVGFASFSHISGGIYKLQKLYVLPPEQRMGIGKCLLESIEDLAKSMGGDTMQLNVNRNNKATNFYSRNGYSIVREEDIEIGSDYFMNDYIMEKTL